MHNASHEGHVAALIRCVLIGGEYISLIKSCQIRRRNECVRVKRHWVTEWNRKLQRKNEARGREKQIVRDREQLQLIDTKLTRAATQLSQDPWHFQVSLCGWIHVMCAGNSDQNSTRKNI